MKTDWKNYRRLEKREIIQSYDQELSPEAEEDGWDEVSMSRVGQPAPDPLCHGHMKYRRPLHLDTLEVRNRAMPNFVKNPSVRS